MPRADMIEMEGIVTEALPGLKFKIDAYMPEHPENRTSVVCVPSGKIKTNYVRILIGDKVLIEVSPYDLTKGRITWRYK